LIIFPLLIIQNVAGSTFTGQPDTVINPTTAVVSDSSKLNVFFDCHDCDFNYLKANMPFINFVRDKDLADVHVFVTETPAGSGGRIYNIAFIGQKRFANITRKLRFVRLPASTDNELRNGLRRVFTLGLICYIADTSLADKLDIQVSEIDSGQIKKPEDKWDNWIFEIYMGGEINKETSQDDLQGNINLEANRITRKWKTRSDFSYDYEKQHIDTDKGVVTSISRRSDFDISQVKSVSPHWSVGTFGNIYSSTYHNTRLRTALDAAVEYNIFPYEQVNRREFTLAYYVGGDYTDYFQETIYLKTHEFLPRHRFRLLMRFNQPWGEARWEINASQYLHDLSKNSIDFYGRINYRLVRGLSFRISANFQIIHDQLYLARQQASLEELLLRQRKVKTDYELGISLGISYSFGSMYNNVVNTRL
jgi:hypothetical protein